VRHFALRDTEGEEEFKRNNSRGREVVRRSFDEHLPASFYERINRVANPLELSAPIPFRPASSKLSTLPPVAGTRRQRASLSPQLTHQSSDENHLAQ
jgi:hypothetical protein